MSQEILRKRRVLEIIGMGNTWLNDSVKRKEFPAPVKLGARAIGWRRSDVEAWLADRQSAA